MIEHFGIEYCHGYSVLVVVTASFTDSVVGVLGVADSLADFVAPSASGFPAGTDELPVFLLSLI
ncbi:MAG TPA: hypothetical protein VNE17_09925 [Nitrolancea sp.]|nr:hypothetical protein [Nitrolancea sp.]